MEIIMRKHPVHGSWSLAAHGELDAQTIRPLRQAAEAAAAMFPALVLDFGAVTFADSSALNLLLLLHDITELHVAAPQPQLLRVLALTGADQVLRIYPSADLACAAATV
ncbi:STAS domain-containing protein [Streptomyces sp. NPDC051214]|uniref:STAS domain-containing protein n=1 Tax=Streptomyces sp. NPDC051214 TaxID=3155282 RepID=UPI003421D804